MKLPLIVDCKGDIGIFSDPKLAELEMEAIDVRNGEYEVHDSEGQVVIPCIEQNERGVELVRLRTSEAAVIEADRVRNKLERLLEHFGLNIENDLTLCELISLAKPYSENE